MPLLISFKRPLHMIVTLASAGRSTDLSRCLQSPICFHSIGITPDSLACGVPVKTGTTTG